MNLKSIALLAVSVFVLSGCKTMMPKEIAKYLPGPPIEPTSYLTMTQSEIEKAAIKEMQRNEDDYFRPLTQAERDKAWSDLKELEDTHWDWITFEQIPDLFGSRWISKEWGTYSHGSFEDACGIFVTISAEQHWLMEFKHVGPLTSRCDRFFNRFMHYQTLGKTEADRMAIYEEVARLRAEEKVRLAEQQRQNAIRDEKLRQKRESPIMMKNRGIRVCKHTQFGKQYPYFEGYVEDSANGRIKIQVNHYWFGEGLQPGGWRPELIWDNPSNWRICE